MTVAVEVFMPCARDIWRLAPVAEGAAALGLEIPPEYGDYYRGDRYHDDDGVVQQVLAPVTDVPAREYEVVLVYAYGQRGLSPGAGAPSHHAEVDRIERQLGQYAGEDGRNSALGVEQPSDKPGEHTGKHRHQSGEPDVDAVDCQQYAHRSAKAQSAVDREVRYVQHTVCDIHAHGHKTPYQPLTEHSGQGVYYRLQEFHVVLRISRSQGRRASPWRFGI